MKLSHRFPPTKMAMMKISASFLHGMDAPDFRDGFEPMKRHPWVYYPCSQLILKHTCSDLLDSRITLTLWGP